MTKREVQRGEWGESEVVTHQWECTESKRVAVVGGPSARHGRGRRLGQVA